MLRYAISDGSLALGHRETSLPFPPPGLNPAAASQPALTLVELRDRLLAHASSSAARQIDFFLLRETALPTGSLSTLSRELVQRLANTQTRLLIHSRLDVALATRADGVHLRSNPGQLTPTHIRTLYTSARLPSPTISLSCHTEDDLHRARILQPNLILFGPIFEKQVHGTPIYPGIGLDALRRACLLAHPIPVLALGGITEGNTKACVEAGAAGVAAIRLFHPSNEPLPI